jgi:hypothetical protein
MKLDEVGFGAGGLDEMELGGLIWNGIKRNTVQLLSLQSEVPAAAVPDPKDMLCLGIKDLVCL